MESNKSVPVVTSSLQSSLFQAQASEPQDQLNGQLLLSDVEAAEIGAKEQLRKRKEPEMKIDSTTPHGESAGALPLAIPAAPYSRRVSKAHALKSDSDLDQAQLTCARVQGQLSDMVSRHSFNQELYKRICTQDLRSFSEDNLITCLEPLLFSRTNTREDTLNVRPIPRSGATGLPEELVELIISRIPFPLLFKARLLSRAWFYKFPFGKMRSLQPSFQNQISSASSRWTTYCPVIFTNTSILCFDRSSWQWKPMLSLSYLPLDVYSLRNADVMYLPRAQSTRNGDCFEVIITTAGPLVCFFHQNLDYDDNDDYNHRIFVSNVIAKSWRQLPDPPQITLGGPGRWHPHELLIKLLQVGTDCYKVLVLHVSNPNAVEAHIYNSRLRNWTVKRFDMNPYIGNCIGFIGDIAYMDKKFILLSGYLENDVMCCLQINDDDEDLVSTNKVEHDAWVRLQIPPHSLLGECFRSSAVFAHKDHRIVFVGYFSDLDRRPRLTNKIGIYQLDTLTWQVTELCRGPRSALVKELRLPRDQYRNLEMRFASDGDFIYIALIFSLKFEVVLTCNLQSHAWQFIPGPPMCFIPGKRLRESQDKRWVESVFQPGSNPFASV